MTSRIHFPEILEVLLGERSGGKDPHQQLPSVNEPIKICGWMVFAEITCLLSLDQIHLVQKCILITGQIQVPEEVLAKTGYSCILYSEELWECTVLKGGL